MGCPKPDDYPKTPEIEKLQSVEEDSQVCGEFLDWLMNRYQVAEYTEETDDSHARLVPITASIKKILAEYFQIDLDAIEREKRSLLEYVRKESK